MPIDKLIPRKLNSDIDAKLIDKASMIDALNLYAGDDSDGGGGVLKNVKGNTKVDQQDAFGENSRVLGSVVDDKTGIAYFFVYSTQANMHGVWAYDPEGKLANDGEPAVRLIYRSAQFNFDSQGFVKGDVIHINSSTFTDRGDEFDKDAVIFFTDNKNEPRKINAYRAYNAGGADLYTNTYDTADFITACPKTPLAPITFSFDRDINRGISNFKGTSGFQFAYQHVYKDGFESSVSSYSDVAFPPSIINQGALTNASHDSYNRCTLYIPQPGSEIKSVKVLAKEGSAGSFLVIDEVDVESLYTNNIYVGTYSFYNDRITKGFSRVEINKQFDSIPRKAKAQAVSDNRLIYGNYLDGFDSVNVDCTAQVVYRDRPQDFVDFTISSNSFIGVHIDEENTDDPDSAKRKSAGFTIDTSSLPDSVSAGTSILFKIVMTPDRNWHIYNSDNSYHQSKLVGEYEEFPTSTEWNTFGNNAENYDEQTDIDSGLTYLRGQSDASNENVLLWAGANEGIVGEGLILKWKTKYYPLDGTQEAAYDARIGTSAANPIILKGGSLLFQAGFTTSLEIGSGFPIIAAKTFEEILLGKSYDELTYKVKINESNLISSVEATLNHSLPVNNHTTISQAYIGQQQNNTDLSRMIMAVMRGNSATNNVLCPQGYIVFKQATAKFKIRPVDNNSISSDTKKAFRLALTSLTNVKPMTCYKSMLVGQANSGVSDYPFLNKWGVIDPEVEFFNEDGSSKSFLPQDYFSYYGDDISIDDLYLGSFDNSVNPVAGLLYRNMIGFLSRNGEPTFDLLTGDEGTGVACVFDGEGGPAGGPSRGGEGNNYDRMRIIHQGSIPICTPLVQDFSLDSGFASISILDGKEPGWWSTQVTRKHSPMWTGRISLVSGYNSQTTFNFDNNDNSVTSLPLLQSGSTTIYTYEENADNIFYSNKIAYPTPSGPSGILLQLDDHSVNFNYLHSGVELSTFVTGNYSGDVFRSFKSNSNHDFGIVYYDERGRHGFVNYLANVFVPGLSSIDRPQGSEGGPSSVAITLNHPPPSWAHYYKIVYGGNSSIDSFIQYSVPNAYVRKFDSENPPNSANIYVSLNYLQGNAISYTSSFGAKSVEGGINMYKFKDGDKLRIISTGPDNERVYYQSGKYEFDIIDLVDVAAPIEGEVSSIVLIDPENQDIIDSPRLQGQFLVLKDNQDANGFKYQDVSLGGSKWMQNCIVEIYSPSKDLGEDEKFYYEMPNTYRVITTASGTLAHSPSTVILNKGDVWFRKGAINMKEGNFDDLIPLEFTSDAEPNFKSYFIESFTATDLHRSDFKGLGRVNLINDEAKETRRESSVTYSDKSNPESSKSRYTSFDSNKLNFNDYDYNKGEINFLSPTSGYLIVLQGSRTSLVPISKNVLSDASGNSSIVSSNVVLGEAIEQAGVGGSDSPESVIERDDRIYYANKKDGKVYLYSKGSGAKDISTNFVGSAIRKAINSLSTGTVKIVGGYDSIKEEYLVTIVSLSPHLTSGIELVSQAGIGVSDTGPTGIGGGPAEGEDGLSVSGFQVFIDTDGDGIIGINEFLNQTTFNVADLPFIPEGEVAVPATLAGISELAGQITLSGEQFDDLSSTLLSVLNGVDLAGFTGNQDNTSFILGGVVSLFASQNNIDLNSAEGLTSLLTGFNLDPTLLAAEDANGESNFSTTFNVNSSYDLIFKLINIGVDGFDTAGISELAISNNNQITRGDLIQLSSALDQRLILDPIVGLPPGTDPGAFDADINDDGVVGTSDLLTILSYFNFFLPEPPSDDTVIFSAESV